MGEPDSEKTFRIIRTWVNPSVQNLIGELLDYQNKTALLKAGMAEDTGKMAVLTLCEQKLRNIELAVNPEHWWQGQKVFTAWELLHRVGEELVLLMGPSELLAQGQKAILDLKMSSVPDAQKNEWITILSESLKKLADIDTSANDAAAAAKEKKQGEITAQVIKTVMNLVNDQVDAGFWDLWAKKFIAFIYLVFLLILAFVSFKVYQANYGFSLFHVILLGAIGGLASGIITGEREDLPKGHFWIPTLYYALVRPTLGALAAIVMFWMLESQFLVKVDPPLPAVTTAFECVSSSSAPGAVKAENRVAADKNHKALTQKQNSSATTGSSVVTISTVKGKQIYLYMLLLLFAGFLGDKLLKTVADKVSAKLFNQSEKTKDSK